MKKRSRRYRAVGVLASVERAVQTRRVRTLRRRRVEAARCSSLIAAVIVGVVIIVDVASVVVEDRWLVRPLRGVNIHVVGQMTGSWAAREVVSGADHGRVRSFVGGRVVLISGRVV